MTGTEAPSQTWLQPSATVYLQNQMMFVQKLNNNGRFTGIIFNPYDSTEYPALFAWPSGSPEPVLVKRLDQGVASPYNDFYFEPRSIDDQGRVVGIGINRQHMPAGIFPAWLDSKELTPSLRFPPFVGETGSFSAISTTTGYIAGSGYSGASSFSLVGKYDAPIPGPSLAGTTFPFIDSGTG